MTGKRRFDIHCFSLFFTFTLGGCLFLFGKCGIINMLLSLAAGTVTYFALAGVFRRFSPDSAAARFVVCAVCVAVLGYTFIRYTAFVTDRALLHTPRAAAGLFFAAVILCFLPAGETGLKKFCLLAFAVSFTVCLIVFSVAANNFEFSNYDCLPDTDIKEIARNYFIIFLPAAVPLSHTKGRACLSGAAGLFAAGLIFTVFSLFTVFNFGRVNDLLKYPVLDLSDTVNVGRIFTRLGSLVHAVIFVTCLIRCVICLKAVRSLYRSVSG